MPENSNKPQKTSAELLKDLNNLPKAPTNLPGMPWQSNGDARRDLLIKNIEIDYADLQKRGSDPDLLDKIKAGQNAIEAYDRIKIKFARDKLARDDMLHSLPEHSAAYRVQKRYCATMDKIEKSFMHNLTDPNYFNRELHGNITLLEKKITVAKKSACITIYNGSHDIIARQSPTINKQFLDQYERTFPDAIQEAKNQAWFRKSEQHIQDLKAMANPQPPAIERKTHSNIKSAATNHDTNKGTTTNKLQTSKEEHQKRLNEIATNVNKVELTVDSAKDKLAQQKDRAPVKSRGSLEDSLKTEKINLREQKPSKSVSPDYNEKSSQLSQLPRKGFEAVGELVGHHAGQATEAVAGAITSVIKVAAIGAWDLTKAAAGKISQLAKSSETLARENTEREMHAMTTAAESEPKTSQSPCKKEDDSVFVKATGKLGKLIGTGIYLALNGAVDLGIYTAKSVGKLSAECAKEAGQALYHKLTTSSQHATGQENTLSSSNQHSPPSKLGAMQLNSSDKKTDDTPDSKLTSAAHRVFGKN